MSEERIFLSLFLILCVVPKIYAQEQTKQDSNSNSQSNFEQRLIASLEFRGNQFIPSDTFYNFIKIKRGNLYDREKLEADLDRLRVLLYAERGYIKARFSQPVVSDTSEGLRITISVEEGILYRYGDIKVEDSTILSPDQVIGLLGIKSGDVVRGWSLQEGMNRLRKIYANRGHVRFVVTPEIDFRPTLREAEEGIVDVTFSIAEGGVFYVRKVEFSGNHTTRDSLVRRRVGISEGEVFNEGRLQTAIRRLNEWGHFERLGAEDYEIHIDEQSHAVDVLIKLKGKTR